jgi:hypothetical protein
MSEMTISLDFTWPASPPTLVEDLFVGARHPERRLEVALRPPPDTVWPCLALGRNWFALSNTSAFFPGVRGLVHSALRCATHLGFPDCSRTQLVTMHRPGGNRDEA